MKMKKYFAPILFIIPIIMIIIWRVQPVQAPNDPTQAPNESAESIEIIDLSVLSAQPSNDGVAMIEQRALNNTKDTDEVTIELILEGVAWNQDITIPVDWSCEGIEDRSVCMDIHALTFLDQVYVAYHETHDNQYGRLIIDYMIDWVVANPNTLEGNEWAWHDDGTARRVYRMSLYYYVLKDICSVEEQQIIEESLHAQAQLLATEDFYTKNHNHGMHQDFSLLVYALLLANEDERANYFSLALQRTGEYLNYVFAGDGVHKEHSPLYARDACSDIIFLQEITKEIAPDYSKNLQNLVEGTEKYLVQIIQPNRMWPSIGDSAKIAVSNKSWMMTNEEYKYALTNGTEGTKPSEEMVFPQGGYAVMRSSWDDSPEEATWMMLLASTFSSTHKHGDDLSLLLYHKGDLFVEGGKRDYNYADEKTAWSYSAYSHNVLLVNGEGFPVGLAENGFQSIKQEALETGIVDYDLTTEVKSVTAMQKRFENIVQYRTLSYDKKENTVVIKDVLETAEAFEGTFLYHVADGVEVEELDNGWNFYRNGELIATASVESENAYELSTVIGEEGEYPYCTWIFEGKKDPRYGSLLIIDTPCTEGINDICMTVYLK